MQLSLTASLPATESVTSTPRQLLKAEGLVMLLGGLVAWRVLGGTWGWFAALFLVPDLSMLGYLLGPRVGAAGYNAGHSLIGPAVLALVGVAAPAFSAWAFLAAALWVAHIGFDRMLGYGLKYASSFNDTHLGRVGKAASR
jgi:hypothetical protein